MAEKDEKPGYGKTCNAHFAYPVQVCALPPGHRGDHAPSAESGGTTDFAECAAGCGTKRFGVLPRGATWMCDLCSRARLSDHDSRCTCAQIQARDQARHFKGCALRLPLAQPVMVPAPDGSIDVPDRFELLTWAGSRVGVLSLLRALKEHNYDETGTEYLRRVVDGRGAKGERSLPPEGLYPRPLPRAFVEEVTNNGKEPIEHFSTFHSVGQVDYSQQLDVSGLQPPVRPDADLERYEDLRVRKYPPTLQGEPAELAAAVSHVERAGLLLVVWNRRYCGWTMPGGKVEADETTGAAQERELREETGLRTLSAVQVYSGETSVPVGPDRGRKVYVFRVLAEGDPEPREGCAVRWMSREEFLECSPFAAFYRPYFAALDQPTRASDLLCRPAYDGSCNAHAPFTHDYSVGEDGFCERGRRVIAKLAPPWFMRTEEEVREATLAMFDEEELRTVPASPDGRVLKAWLAEQGEDAASLRALIEAVDEAERKLVGDDPPHPSGRAVFVKNLAIMMSSPETVPPTVSDLQGSYEDGSMRGSLRVCRCDYVRIADDGDLYERRPSALPALECPAHGRG